MLSFALVAVARFDGEHFVRLDPHADSRYWELRPFGHGTCIDIRSLYIGAAGSTYAESSKSHLPPELLPQSAHTHNALDDAVEQGELFSNLFEWVLRHRPSYIQG
jgi:hypothetical protein